jgi:hypothetical protein
MVFVFPFLVLGLLLPLADMAVASFKYISAVQALRAFGQSILYSPPTDFSDTSSWRATAVAKADSSYPVSGLQLICGDGGAVCSASNAADVPKYYSYTTTVTLSPIVLKSMLCPGGNCTISLTYSERFQ